MPRGSGPKGSTTFAHIKSTQHKARQLKSLEDVVTLELGAPYAVQHLPDTDQIVLTPEAGGGGGGGKSYGTNVVGEDRGGSVAHPGTPSIEERGVVPHPSSS